MNLILTDFEPGEDWTLPKVLKERTGSDWDVECRKTNRLHNGIMQNLWRRLVYFLFPLQILLKRRYFDKILSWQQFFGLNIAFFSRLLCLKKTNHLYIMTFIYKRKSGILGSIYHKYMNYVVTSKYIDKFICFSKSEIEYYNSIFNVDKEKFVFVPLGISPSNDIEIFDEGYVFAAGRSNRDYNFLIRVLNSSKYKLVLACDSYEVGNSTNIKFYNHCYGTDMLKLMARCHVVVVPLKNVLISSGQLVVLQAMSLGKPVICTKSDGIKDYVIDGKTGELVYNHEEDWLDALNKMYIDEHYYNALIMNSKQTFSARYTEIIMFNNIASVVE